jgi:hypothetical protein
MSPIKTLAIADVVLEKISGGNPAAIPLVPLLSAHGPRFVQGAYAQYRRDQAEIRKYRDAEAKDRSGTAYYPSDRQILENVYSRPRK